MPCPGHPTLPPRPSRPHEQEDRARQCTTATQLYDHSFHTSQYLTTPCLLPSQAQTPLRTQGRRLRSLQRCWRGSAGLLQGNVFHAMHRAARMLTCYLSFSLCTGRLRRAESKCSERSGTRQRRSPTRTSRWTRPRLAQGQLYQGRDRPLRRTFCPTGRGRLCLLAHRRPLVPLHRPRLHCKSLGSRSLCLRDPVVCMYISASGLSYLLYAAAVFNLQPELTSARHDDMDDDKWIFC